MHKIKKLKINETKNQTMFTLGNATMGSQLLVSLYPSSDFDKCEAHFYYSKLHEFPIRSIDSVLVFTQADIGVNVFVYITLVMRVDGNIG